MKTTNGNLYVCRLNEEQHKQTCGYWYTVTTRGMPHKGFATRAGLDRYLAERGLRLAGSLDKVPSHCAIHGSYREESHLHDAHEFGLLVGDHTRTLSNGDWVEAIITHDEDGDRTVHTLNPNIKDRPTFDYAESRALMS